MLSCGTESSRVKYGSSEEAIVKAIREHASESLAETDGSPWVGASSLTDEQLLAVIVWSVTAKTACARVQADLATLSA